MNSNDIMSPKQQQPEADNRYDTAFPEEILKALLLNFLVEDMQRFIQSSALELIGGPSRLRDIYDNAEFTRHVDEYLQENTASLGISPEKRRILLTRCVQKLQELLPNASENSD